MQLLWLALGQSWSIVTRQLGNNLLGCRSSDAGRQAHRESQVLLWVWGWEGHRMVITEPRLRLRGHWRATWSWNHWMFPHTCVQWWIMQQEQDKAKCNPREPGRQTTFPLWCPSSALYWQKLNIVLTVKQKYLGSPVHYHRANTEGWTLSWEPINL